jgi:hypothetical protein
LAHAAWRVPNARITLEKGVAALRVWLDDDQCAAAPAQGFLVPFQLEAAHDPVVLRFVVPAPVIDQHEGVAACEQRVHFPAPDGGVAGRTGRVIPALRH